MRVAGPVAFGALVLLCTVPAQALTISNIDPKPHKAHGDRRRLIQ